ncbi:MAG: prephenate dehydrogenase, partial [Clostridiales bacterium]|nr:prephenate dehydrogenase [Candidatus Apopatocola equi]
LGLMGGSYAEALSDQGYEVGALARRQETIDYALRKGLIRHGRAEIDPAYVAQFDLLVFALYPRVFLSWLEENQQYIRPGALITDVTGVKGSIVYQIQDTLRSDLEFIPAHPMAGREVYGVENATKTIFTEANYIVVPTEKNTPEAITLCAELGRVLGFRKVSQLTPEQHDEMIGFLSQLTHCIAVALMVCKDSKHLVDYTGNSFRDLTRIAKINDAMWSELFMLNRSELLAQMDLFEENFMKLRNALAEGDTETMREMMRLSTERREYFD